MSGRLVERRSNDPWERFYQQHLPAAPHLPEDHQRLWLYYKLWPNMAFAIYPDQVDFMQWLPLSPTVSVLREMCFALPDDRREMKLVRYANWRINRTVNAEDTWLIERVQRGMASQSYEIGPIGASEVCLRSFARKIRERIPEARLHRAPAAGWRATSSPSRLREGGGGVPIFCPSGGGGWGGGGPVRYNSRSVRGGRQPSPDPSRKREGSKTVTQKYDALIIGGGHNGLVCAFYLARAGLKVRVLARRHIVGGAAVTEEFRPGFRNSTASFAVSLLRPKVVKDMRLHERGWRIIERTISNFFPHEDGYLKLGGGTARTQAEFARFSAKDAETFPKYEDALERVAEVLSDMALKTPPNAGGDIRALLAAAAQGKRLAGMVIEAQRDVMDLFVNSARSFLDSWYDNEYIKAAFGFDAVVGNFASPDTPGSAYVLLNHVFGEVNGKKGAWGHRVGGMGAITQFMAEACPDMGVELSLEAPVAKVLVDRADMTPE